MARPTVQVTRCHARSSATMRSVPTAARTTSSVNMRAVCMRASCSPRCCLQACNQARVAGLCLAAKWRNSKRKSARRIMLRRWA
eukprot:3337621-Pleurochrysis_carterae.AAC.1